MPPYLSPLRAPRLTARCGRGRSRCAARQLAVVLGEDDFLHPLAGFAVQGMRDVLEGAVLAPLGRHGDEQPGIAVDHLEIAHDEAVIEGDGDVGLEPFLVDRKDADLGDLHGATPSRRCTIPMLDGSPQPDELSNARPPLWRTASDSGAIRVPAAVRGRLALEPSR